MERVRHVRRRAPRRTRCKVVLEAEPAWLRQEPEREGAAVGASVEDAGSRGCRRHPPRRRDAPSCGPRRRPTRRRVLDFFERPRASGASTCASTAIRQVRPALAASTARARLGRARRAGRLACRRCRQRSSASPAMRVCAIRAAAGSRVHRSPTTQQGRGIGTRLLEQLAERAAAVGDRTLRRRGDGGERGDAERLPRTPASASSASSTAARSRSRFPIAPTDALRAPASRSATTLAVVASLRPFFAPASVAVDRRLAPARGRSAASVFRNVLAGEFDGAAYPVNRSGEPVAGRPRLHVGRGDPRRRSSWP